MRVTLDLMHSRHALAWTWLDMQVIASLAGLFGVYNGDLVVCAGLPKQRASLTVLSACSFLKSGLFERVGDADQANIHVDGPAQVASTLVGHAVGVAHAACLELFVQVEDNSASAQSGYALADRQAQAFQTDELFNLDLGSCESMQGVVISEVDCMQSRMVRDAKRREDLGIADSASVGLDPDDIAFGQVQAGYEERLIMKMSLGELADQTGFTGAWTASEKV